MNKRIVSILTVVLMLVSVFQAGVFAEGAGYETIYNCDFTADGATSEGLVAKHMVVQADPANSGQSLNAGSNAYKGAVYFPENLGECYRVSGKTFYTWNSIRIHFNAEELTETEKGFDIKNGYRIDSGKEGGTNHYTRFQYIDESGVENAVNGWTDLSHTVSHDYVTCDFVFSYNRGIVNWSISGGGETRSFTYDLTEGGTKEPASKSGYFIIDGIGADTLNIYNLKIEKVKNPTITDKSSTLENVGVYKTTDSVDVWVKADRAESEIAEAKLYIDDVYKADMEYNTQNNAVCASVSLSGLANGIHTITAEVVDTFGGGVKYDAKSVYIADYTVALEAFVADNAEVTAVSQAAGKTMTAKLKCGADEEYIAMACVIKNGNLLSIKCKKITSKDKALDIAVPSDTSETRVNVTMFKSFAEPKPLSGNIEIK